MQTLKNVLAQIFVLPGENAHPNMIFSMYNIEIPIGTPIRNLKKEGDSSFSFEFNKGQGWIKAISQTDPLSD